MSGFVWHLCPYPRTSNRARKLLPLGSLCDTIRKVLLNGGEHVRNRGVRKRDSARDVSLHLFTCKGDYKTNNALTVCFVGAGTAATVCTNAIELSQ